VASNSYTPDTPGSAASKFGQMIGEAFERIVIEFIQAYLESHYKEYEILAPEQDKQIITLSTLGGTPRQLDTVIIAKGSTDPVALLETKWLKDARHHNDKGAWILQLREVRKQYATVRGAAAILAGYWTEGVGIMLASNAGVKMVLVATDQEVYDTLQKPLDEYLKGKSFRLDAELMRKSYPRPYDLANFLIDLHQRGELDRLARTWVNFVRKQDDNGISRTGADLVKRAISELLSQLPENPQIKSFEIALQIDTGNTIYQEFKDIESAIDFIQNHFRNPNAILQRITPRKTPKQPD
jgi:hypothetical protein